MAERERERETREVEREGGEGNERARRLNVGAF